MKIHMTYIRGYILIAAALLLVCGLTGCGSIPQAMDSQTRTEPYDETQQCLPEEDYSDKYAYCQLTPEAQAVYGEVLFAMQEHMEKITVSTRDAEILKLVFDSVRADHGGLFWVDGYTYTEYSSGGQVAALEFAPQYTMSREERGETQKAVDAAAERLLGGISSEDPDYQKARFIFDTLARTVEYNPEAENGQNIISVFLQGETVCQGYACGVQYLCELLDMPCTVVTGMAGGEAHAWNLVRLDGDYYYMDVTWGNSACQNDGSGREKYVNYSYFAMTSQELGLTHEPDAFLPMPDCTSRQDSYFWQEGCYFADWYPQEIGSVLGRLGEGEVSVKFADEALYRQAQQYFIEEQHIRDYYGAGDSFYYMTDDERYVLTFFEKM